MPLLRGTERPLGSLGGGATGCGGRLRRTEPWSLYILGLPIYRRQLREDLAWALQSRGASRGPPRVLALARIRAVGRANSATFASGRGTVHARRGTRGLARGASL